MKSIIFALTLPSAAKIVGIARSTFTVASWESVTSEEV